jgi:hypothetical protein
MYWDVVEVKPEPDYNLFVPFNDGLSGRIRLDPPELTGAGDVDLAPDAIAPGYGFKEINLPISRTFAFYERLRLGVIGEAENLFNNNNACCTNGGSGAVVATYNAPDLLRIPSTFNSRQVQVGARLRF